MTHVSEDKSMVENYFAFTETPFGVTSDPRFFFENAVYKKSLAELAHGIKAKKGLMLVTGEIGTGKTILVRKLMRDLDITAKFIFISSSHLTSDGLLDVVAEHLGILERKTRFQVVQGLRKSLLEELKNGRSVALIVDEAQKLGDRALESLCSLSNLETDNEKLLQIVLVTQPALLKRLSKDSLRQIKQRIVIQHRLTGLQTKSEVQDYIRHRLHTANYHGPEIFSQEAIEAIWRYSSGTPRLINIICDKSLGLICEAGARQVSANVILKAAGEFQLGDELPLPNFEEPEIRVNGITTVKSYAEANSSEVPTIDEMESVTISPEPDAWVDISPADELPPSKVSDELRAEAAETAGVSGPSFEHQPFPIAKSEANRPPNKALAELIESVKRTNENQFQKRLGLKWKIAGTFSGIFLILCTLLVVGVYHLTQRALREQVEKRALTIATNLSDASASPVLGNDLLSLNTLLQKYMFRDGVAYAFAQNAQGAIVAHTFGSFPSELRRGLTTGRQRTTLRREVSLQKKPIYETSVPVLDGQLGSVHVGFWEDAMTKEIQPALLLTTGAIAIMAVLGALLSFFVAQWIVRPITQLTHLAEKITRGDLQPAADIPKSHDEIGDLARSLERMRASLKAAMSRLGHESV